VDRFFREYHDVLRDPDQLRARFGLLDRRLDPASVHTQADADLSLLIELPLIAPALLIEPLVKMQAIHEQQEAKQALALAEVTFEEVLALAVESFGEGNLLKIQLGMHAG